MTGRFNNNSTVSTVSIYWMTKYQSFQISLTQVHKIAMNIQWIALLIRQNLWTNFPRILPLQIMQHIETRSLHSQLNETTIIITLFSSLRPYMFVLQELFTHILSTLLLSSSVDVHRLKPTEVRSWFEVKFLCLKSHLWNLFLWSLFDFCWFK